jgi:ketosteroid isomerase-like protein
MMQGPKTKMGTSSSRIAAVLSVIMFLSSVTLYALQTKPHHEYAAAAEQSVTKLEQEWFADQLALNWPKLKSMIAEDFVLTESDGKLGNRETMLDGYKTEASSTSSIKMTFLATHAVAADTVIATGLDDITLKGNDGRLSHRYERFTDTWILRDGRWQCVAEQLTLGHP